MDKNEYLYMGDEILSATPEITPEIQKAIDEVEKKIKDKYPGLIED